MGTSYWQNNRESEIFNWLKLSKTMTSKCLFALLLFTSMLMISCEQNQLNEARVAVEVPGADSLAVKISYYSLFKDGQILAQLNLDSANYRLKIVSARPSRPSLKKIRGEIKSLL